MAEPELRLGSLSVKSLATGAGSLHIGSMSVKALIAQKATPSELSVASVAVKALLVHPRVHAADGESVWVNMPGRGWQYPMTPPPFTDTSTKDEPVWAVTATQ